MSRGADQSASELLGNADVAMYTAKASGRRRFAVFDPTMHAAIVERRELSTELARGNLDRFHAILSPTVPLSRHIFAAPTRFYKTGVVFMAWLNGHQSHFTMVGGQQSARSLLHLVDVFRLVDAANLLPDPDLAVARMRNFLCSNGFDA